jgi:DNA (cytosine-5)-methyltransferase 1
MSGQKSPIIFEFARLVSELKPKAFLFENVPNLRSMCRDGFSELLRQLSASGYVVQYKKLSACDFGSPTVRKRLFVVGLINDGIDKCFHFPTPTHGESNQDDLFEQVHPLCPYVTVSDVLAGLPDVGTLAAQQFLNHTGRTHRPTTIEHIITVAPGRAVTKSFRYRPSLDGLSRSLTAGVDHSTKSYLHPPYYREMSVREYARLHGFPDSWEFAGNHHNGIKQLANAVPIPLGQAIARSMCAATIGASELSL